MVGWLSFKKNEILIAMNKRHNTMRPILFALIAMLLFASCNLPVSPKVLKNATTGNDYEHFERYTKGGGTVSTTVKDIEINWFCDSITIEAYDGSEVVFSETSPKRLDDSTSMYYLLDDHGTSLTIQFCRAKVKIKNDSLHKQLHIFIPRDMHLDDIEINGVSHAITLTGIHCENLEINSVDASIVLDGSTIGDLEVNGVDEELTAIFHQMPNDIEFNTVDGNYTLYVPLDAGMTIEMNGLSSELHSGLPVRKEGSHNDDATIIGNGACDIEVNGVDSHLTLYALSEDGKVDTTSNYKYMKHTSNKKSNKKH